MRTAPPTVPGMLTPNSMPDRPARAARAATAGSRAAPPQRMRGAATTISASSPSSLITSPATPSSDTSRLEPEPTAATATPAEAAHESSSRSARSLPARAKNSPVPPVRTVVRRSSGYSRCTPAGAGGLIAPAAAHGGLARRRAPSRSSRAHQLASQGVHVAGAHHHAEVALGQQLAQHRSGGGERGQPVDRAPGGGIGGRLGDHQAAD